MAPAALFMPAGLEPGVRSALLSIIQEQIHGRSS